MTTTILAAVLLGALIHAAWNALIKGQPDQLAASAMVATGASVMAVPVMLLLPAPAPASWPYLAASAAIHVGYFALVGLAYRGADLGVAYPITRGSAPLFTAVFAFLLIGEALSPTGWLAVAILALGILTLAGDAIRRGGLTWATGTAAAINAAVVVVYTLVDGIGARAAGSGPAYVAWMLFGTGILVLLLMFGRHGSQFAAEIRRSWLVGLAGGALGLASYAIALWAMTRAPIGPVAALRETSVLFAAVLGAILFKEPFGPMRWIALALILGGIALLRLPVT